MHALPAVRQGMGVGRGRPWRLAWRQHRRGEEVTCVCKSWHDSCWMVHSGTRAGAPGASPLTGRTVVSSLSCTLGVREEHGRRRADRAVRHVAAPL